MSIILPESRRFLLIVIPLLAVCVSASTSDITPADDETLTNVDIVRMTSHGVPVEEIVAAIRDAPSVAFDLDPEIVEELRRAGVTETVIEAMRDAAPPPVGPPDHTEAPRGELNIIIEGVGGTGVKAKAADPADWTAVAPLADPNGTPVELALYVICLHPVHVPDLWQNQTPLDGLGRHALIWMVDSTLPIEKGSKTRYRFLSVPEQARIEADAGTHPVEVGVAARLGDHDWIRLAAAEGSLSIEPGAETRLVLRMRTRRLRGPRPPLYDIEIVDIGSPLMPGQAPAD